MHKIWMVFEPRQSFMGLVAFLAVLAFSIHLLLLSTARFNWFDFSYDGNDKAAKPATAQMSALPPSY